MEFTIKNSPALVQKFGKYSIFVVSPCDESLVNSGRWYRNNVGYIRGRLGKRYVLLHREILGLVEGDARLGDHLDRNTLNCVRENLRICDKSENTHNQLQRNPTGFKGVSHHHRKFAAKAGYGFQRYFDTAEAAARCYDEWARMFYSKPRVNFPRGSELSAR